MQDRRTAIAEILMTVMACLWLAVFPLASDFTYTHITHTKWIIALSLGGVTIIVGLAAWLLRAWPRRGSRFCFAVDPVRLLCILCFAWMGLSAIFGKYASCLNGDEQLTVLWGAKRYEGLVTQLLCYAAVMLGMSAARSRLRVVTWAAAAGVLAFCTVAAMQYTGGNPLGFYPGKRNIYTNYEFQSTLGNIDMGCGYLLIVLPLLLGGWVFGHRRSDVILLLIAMAGTLQLLLTEVQSGMLGLLFVGALLVLLALWKPEWRCRAMIALGGLILCAALKTMFRLPWLGAEGKTISFAVSGKSAAVLLAGLLVIGAAFLPVRLRAIRGRYLIAGAAVLLAVALLVVALLPISPLEGIKAPNALWELHEMLNGRVEDHFGSWRLGCWRHVLEMSTADAQSLLLGYGPDTFWYSLKDHLAEEGVSLGEKYDNPHNLYLTILINNGLPALLFFAAMLVLLVIRCLRRATPACLTLLASIGAYCVQGVFCFSMCIVTPMFWAVLGMACAMTSRFSHAEEPRQLTEQTNAI